MDGTFSPAGQEQLIVFKNPICSLPEVGGGWGGGEGSVSTVTWHWKESTVVRTWLLAQHRSLELPCAGKGEPGTLRTLEPEQGGQVASDRRSWHPEALESDWRGPTVSATSLASQQPVGTT